LPENLQAIPSQSKSLYKSPPEHLQAGASLDLLILTFQGIKLATSLPWATLLPITPLLQ
jgi:hypothetical protein